MKIVITGGHHSSALPVIDQFRSKYPGTELYWFGHRRSLASDKNDTLEFKEITALGIPFYNLQAGKVYKTFNLLRLLKVPFGFIQAFRWLLKIKPDVILSFGGYLAVPTVISGWVLGIPSITHEQTVVVGYANKLLSTFVKKICIGWKDSVKYFPANKIVYSGVPLRKAVFEIGSDSFNSANSLPTIYITAGKTGSHTINEVVKEALPELLSVCNVIHQSGDHSKFNDYGQLESIYKEVSSLANGKFYLRKFVLDAEIGEAFNRSALVVSRSGAHTVTELLALEKPCVLIPIPWVSHDEQKENALILQKYGLAEILEEKDLSEDTFFATVKKVLGHIHAYKLNDKEAAEMVNLNAAEIIADETYRLTQRNN
ncbi:hypothetical protein A3K01_01045 [candidate division WWE3 bacterium RIFOXYD1_FULL_43_17]|uniref:UDP-N-acetylglucosamine--N-acetylmuramyl-(pentapeptide) pyrophosphoryl-undecaprenol N-acetylglucosamine transferase n=3 Tax=Katanobacteria TaxID=422282 RepID=A0A1F4XB39_UNCKA|nr:MAG: hypothetical protein UU59_C0019G0002 [candidate division WWE3 bacterium GW2011_GWE1_41_27]KKS60555.1 MAG: hypothetical protein UV26_C0003G0009 [candidate division WWE3 bacterium GW2011_GWF2_42_42]OGC78892.1 MAG: hypothetical protein A3K01_01045 [candidate division WWE3 bacterium RIFOXYD1_FULL_43_17]